MISGAPRFDTSCSRSIPRRVEVELIFFPRGNMKDNGWLRDLPWVGRVGRVRGVGPVPSSSELLESTAADGWNTG